MRKFRFAFLAVLVFCAQAAMAVPNLINYQGYLTRSSGTPLDTVVSITFKMYSSTSAASLFWTETQPSCSVRVGLINASLGSLIAIPDSFNLNEVWLGITIGTDNEMQPRRRFSSVPYAYRVGTIDGANGGTITGQLRVTDNANIGTNNINPGNYAFVAGENDSAMGDHSAVLGGSRNVAAGGWSVIAGGYHNSTTYSNSTVGGGAANHATGGNATIAGGNGNNAAGMYSTIAGGLDNWTSKSYAFVGGGYLNGADSSYTTVCGGYYNLGSGNYSFIGGGGRNHARGLFSFVGGGGGSAMADSNSAAGDNSVIGGGANNNTTSEFSVIGGGRYNSVTGTYVFLGSGESNETTGDFGTLSGGYNNAVAGMYGTVPGGSSCEANGKWSFAAGRRAKANDDGSFVWADTTASNFSSNAANQFNVRASGGVRMFANASATLGAQLMPGTTAWTSLSDSTKKTDMRRVDTKQVLDKVAQLPISEWRYKDQPNSSIRHIGPMAQDFWKQFHLGEDSLGISTIDPDGIALAAIQELAKRNEKLEAEVARLRPLEPRIAQLEKQLQLLVDAKNTSTQQTSFKNK